jgi:hypothetical protein
MRVRDWLAERHALWLEVVLIVGFYFASDASRSLSSSSRDVAADHAGTVVSIEQAARIFVERDFQDTAHSIPGLAAVLSLCYLTMHVAVTSTVLLWLHQRRPFAFPRIRTALMIATLIGLVGYVVFPAAPPRLADLGIADGSAQIEGGPAAWFYNPYAAVPSMHIGYAVIVGVALIAHGASRATRLLGGLYPLAVLFVIVATGNHFLFDAIAGALVAAVAALAAAALPQAPRRDHQAAPKHRRSLVGRVTRVQAERKVRTPKPAET